MALLFEHFFGGMMGEDSFEKIQNSYGFLSYVWDPGDEIFIFGFRRGAYTARSLPGMIASLGYLRRILTIAPLNAYSMDTALPTAISGAQ
jgi:uncharacterized protein (DUF2235 family)